MKRFLILVLCLFAAQSTVSAYELDEGFGFEKVMLMRNDIQNRLNLTAEQQEYRSKINEKYHPLYNSKFAEIGEKINEIGILANSSNCTKEQIDALTEQFKTAEDELFEINKNYEKEIKTMLTPKQKIKYSFLKYDNRRKLKKEFRQQIKTMKNQ